MSSHIWSKITSSWMINKSSWSWKCSRWNNKVGKRHKSLWLLLRKRLKMIKKLGLRESTCTLRSFYRRPIEKIRWLDTWLIITRSETWFATWALRKWKLCQGVIWKEKRRRICLGCLVKLPWCIRTLDDGASHQFLTSLEEFLSLANFGISPIGKMHKCTVPPAMLFS